MLLCKRDAAGRLLPMDALQRFADKCRFDPTTGCVVWTGGTTAGRGNSAVYGSFWFEGRRWFAHRWSGVHIHGLDLGGLQAGHDCPMPHPNTLCVQHVTGQTQRENLAEQNSRMARQTPEQRRYWLLVHRGYEPAPEAHVSDPDALPFHEPPEWFRPFMAQPEECPF